MHLGGVLPQAGGLHMLGLFDGDAVDVVDDLAHLIIPEPVRLTGQRKVVVGEIQTLGDHQIRRGHGFGQIGDGGFGRGRVQIAFADHDPAHIAQDLFAALVQTTGAHVNNARFPVRVLFEADHLGFRAQRVALIDRTQEPPLGIAKVRHRVQRHIRNGFAKHRVKGDQIVQRRRG